MSWIFNYDKIAIVKVDQVDLHCDGEEPTVIGTLFEKMFFNDINEFRQYFNSPQWEMDSNNRLQCSYDKYFSPPPLRAYCSAAITDVIFNDPATIVFWADGTKTVVQAHDEKFDKEKGLAMAIAKKTLGNKGNYFNVFKKFCEED